MKFGIFILLVLGFCFNIVAPYNYGGYQQGAYQQQSYPQISSPIYTAHRPAVINYGPPQQAVNYAPGPSETQYLHERKSEQQVHQEAIQRKVVEDHSDAIFVEPPLPQVYSERPLLYLPSPPPERNYDNYGRVFAPEYPVQESPQWGLHNSHQSGLPVQEHYREGSGLGYPQWQTGGYKAVPHQNEYYGGNYERQIYKNPVQYVAQPKQVKPAEISPISVSERKAEGLKHNEFYGSPYEQRNAYNPPVQYVAQPQQAQHVVEVLSNTENTQSVQPQNGYNGSSNSYERQNTYNTVVQYLSPLEQVKAEEASLGSERTQDIKQEIENYGSTYETQNAFNTPAPYTQPQQAVAVTSSSAGMKTQAVPSQNQYLDSSYEPQNVYNTPPYLAKSQPVKPVEALLGPENKIQAVPQQNEYYGNPNEQKIFQDLPMPYVAQPEQVKNVESSVGLETKTQVIKQQNQNYGNPYEHQNVYNPVVQYLAQQQAKPVEESLGSEMITQVINQQNEFYRSPYEQTNARDVPAKYVAQPQQTAVAEALSVPKTQEVQSQNKYYDNTYEQKNTLITPVQNVAQPQQAKPVAKVSSDSEMKSQAVQPHKYYDSSFEQQNAYYAPAQHKAQAEAESSLASETNIPEKLASKPEVLDHLTFTPQKGRYLIIHQNGTIEHVDIIDDSLLGNSQFFKSSDLRNRVTRPKETKVPVENKIASTPSPLNIDNQNKSPRNPDKKKSLVPHPRPLVSKEVKPATLPIIKDNPKNDYVPVQNNLNNYYTELSTILPEPVNNNYNPISDFKQNPIEPHKNEPNKSEYYTSTWKNHYENKPKIEIIVPVHNPNVEIYTNSWRNNEETNPLKPLSPSPFQQNSEHNYHSSTTTVGLNNHRNSANKGHWSPMSKEENNYNPLENQKSNNHFHVQNNYQDITNPSEYEATQVAYNAKDTDAFNPLVESATAITLQSDFQSIPKELDEISTPLALALPKSLDILDIFAQKPTQESNNNTSSNVQNYSEAANSSTEEFKNIITTEASLLTQPDNVNYGYPIIGDAYNNNDGTVDETTPRTTDMQDSISEIDVEDDDEQFIVEANTEYINNSPVTVEDKIMLSHKEDKTTKAPTIDKTPLSPEEDHTELPYAKEQTKLSRVEPHNTTSPTNDKNDEDKETIMEGQYTKDVLVTKDVTTEKPLGVNEVVVDEAFWDAVYSSNETGGFNDLFIFNVKVDEPVIEKNSRSFMLANGTYVEEIEEIYWEHKDDAYPKEMKFTRITKNHDPNSIRSGNTKSKSSKEGCRSP